MPRKANFRRLCTSPETGGFWRMCYAEVLCFWSLVRSLDGNGEGGIRTLGSLLGYGALAKRCFRPLSHLTKNRLREYREEMSIANTDLRRVLAISSELLILDC